MYNVIGGCVLILSLFGLFVFFVFLDGGRSK